MRPGFMPLEDVPRYRPRRLREQDQAGFSNARTPAGAVVSSSRLSSVQVKEEEDLKRVPRSDPYQPHEHLETKTPGVTTPPGGTARNRTSSQTPGDPGARRSWSAKDNRKDRADVKTATSEPVRREELGVAQAAQRRPQAEQANKQPRHSTNADDLEKQFSSLSMQEKDIHTSGR